MAALAARLKETPPPETVSIRRAIDELLPHIKRLVSLGYSQRQIAVMLQERIKASETTLRSYMATALKADQRANGPDGKRPGKTKKK